MCIEDITCHEILLDIVAVPKSTQIYSKCGEKLHQPHTIELIEILLRSPVHIIKVKKWLEKELDCIRPHA